MTKSKLLTYLVLLCFAGAIAQETGATLTANAGLTSSGGSGSLAYSLGEPVVGTVQNGPSLSQGFWAATVTVIELSVNDFDLEEELAVFPNPVRDVLYIESTSDLLQEMKLSIFDQQGRLIQERALDLVADRQVDLSAMNSGVYLIRFEAVSLGKQKTMKIIKN